MGGIFGLILLFACVWVIVQIFQSSASTGAKVFWTVLVLILPLIGLILWLIAGPRSAKR
ncbi:PLDc N-terminal domain-containing protein [Desulfatitalea alkaliphila]|uniref:PLDc N-terminal domain-containing protein n=1 Tax=Desulfatitalea alkaliphila TaxID=2929485 RepID=UPI003CCF8B5E